MIKTSSFIKRQNILIAVLMIIIFLIAFFSQKVVFVLSNPSMRDMKLQVEKSSKSDAAYQLLWFETEDSTIKLCLNMLLETRGLNLYALDKGGAICPIVPAQIVKHNEKPVSIECSDNYSGTICAVLPPFSKDINNDGTNENIRLSSKIDTLLTQGLEPVKTTFLNDTIPMELFYKGDGKIIVYLNKKPLAGRNIKLISNRGLDRSVKTDDSGAIGITDLRDLRSGINVIYLDQKSNTYYISSYMVQSNTLFSKSHFDALKSLLIVLIISLFFIMAIAVLRLILFSKKGTAGKVIYREEYEEN